MLLFIIHLKKYRKLQNLTQKQLADKVKVTQQYIANLENNENSKNPTLSIIASLCYALGICPYDLISFNCTKKDFAGECNNCKRKHC